MSLEFELPRVLIRSFCVGLVISEQELGGEVVVREGREEE